MILTSGELILKPEVAAKEPLKFNPRIINLGVFVKCGEYGDVSHIEIIPFYKLGINGGINATRINHPTFLRNFFPTIYHGDATQIAKALRNPPFETSDGLEELARSIEHLQRPYDMSLIALFEGPKPGQVPQQVSQQQHGQTGLQIYRRAAS